MSGFEGVTGCYKGKLDHQWAVYDADTKTLWYLHHGNLAVSHHYEGKQCGWRLHPGFEDLPQNACAECGAPCPGLDYLCGSCRSA
jgi:hypothetical protein